ncbi:hypothetical protein NEOLEDRAFT_565030 [Neolentinus lepideus HHB14362 ss-1]|uniref:Uncharacterized protein n=1 Tax=Neolentinus lepideus HHB14362 ss-1 TaxID=1314782 RepID=A0A165R2X8_9AGAM|nr:hypothetical protein NEOLEDRAFT_565030 [Neolentinus lepideus HHB14362 ss-1]
MHPWRDPENVVLHSVDCATAWPEETKALIEPLRRPLPEWVYCGPYPFTSKHCRSLVAELKQQRPVISSTGSASTSNEPSSKDMLRLCFDTALCTTALLRSLMLREPEITSEPISKTSILANVLRNVLLIGIPDALPIYEAEYVLPRHPSSPHNPLFKFTHKTSTAALLVCNPPIEVSTGPDAHLPSCSSSDTSEPISSEDREGSSDALSDTSILACSEPADDSRGFSHPVNGSAPRRLEVWELAAPENLVEEFTADDSEEYDEECTLQEPILNRHLLATASPSDNTLLPFLCMSEEEDLFGMLASGLYQRYAWGIKEPIVALTYSSGQASLQLVVAWLEDCNTSDKRLPSVHAAFENSSNSLSLFNLCDPIGVLRLTAFLLSLREHAEHLRCLVSEMLAGTALVSEPFLWRSDFDLEEEIEEDNDNDFASGIQKWAREVSEAVRGTGCSISSQPVMPPKTKARKQGSDTSKKSTPSAPPS